MKVYRGTQGDDRKPCRWVQVNIPHQWDLSELVEGLCSKYARDRWDNSDPLPDHLPLARIMETVKSEYSSHGTTNVWTWSDPMGMQEGDTYREWAEGVILQVLPELKIPQ